MSAASLSASLRSAALHLQSLWHSAPPPARVAVGVMAAAGTIALLRSTLVRRSASRLSHRCFTHVTNGMIALTTTRWTAKWMEPNTIRGHATTGVQERNEEESEPLLQVTTHATEAASSSSSSSAVPSAGRAASSPSSSFPSPPVRDVLLTIHGYLGLPRPFFLFRAPFVNAGFHVEDYSYSSGGSMDAIADDLCARIEQTIREVWRRETEAAAARGQPLARGCSPLRFSFVCHSMGGLVLRTAINSGRFPIPMPDAAADSPASSPPLLSMGRIVMIATPNGGSAYARKINQWPRVKQFVLGFARLTSNKSKQRAAAAATAASSSSAVSASTSVSSSRSSSAPVAPAPLPDVLACGDLLMSHPASWFHRNILLPRCLYPRTLVIAGTMSLSEMFLPAPSDGTVRLEETYLPQPPPPPGEEETGAADTAPHNRQSNGVAASASNGTEVAASSVPVVGPVPTPIPSSRFVCAGPAGSSHMSFHAMHSLLVAHPGVIAAALKFIQTGNAEPEKTRGEWD